MGLHLSQLLPGSAKLRAAAGVVLLRGTGGAAAPSAAIRSRDDVPGLVEMAEAPNRKACSGTGSFAQWSRVSEILVFLL